MQLLTCFTFSQTVDPVIIDSQPHVAQKKSLFLETTVIETPQKPKGLIGKQTKNGFDISLEDIRSFMKPQKTQYAPTKNPKLEAAIAKIVKKHQDKTKISDFGLYFKDLKSGIVYGKYDKKMASTTTFGHSEAYFNGASVAKLYLCFATYKLAEYQFIDLDVTLLDRYTGEKFTLRDQIRRAIRFSDNHAFCLIVRSVGPKAISEVLKIHGITANYIYGEIGADGSKYNTKRYGTTKTSRVNPYGAGIILETVYRESVTGNKLMKEFDLNLRNNIYSTRIPKALGYKYPVAHKTGTWEEKGIYNDAAIVYNKYPYILVFFTNDQSSAQAHSFIRGVTAEINQYVTKMKR